MLTLLRSCDSSRCSVHAGLVSWDMWVILAMFQQIGPWRLGLAPVLLASRLQLGSRASSQVPCKLKGLPWPGDRDKHTMYILYSCYPCVCLLRLPLVPPSRACRPRRGSFTRKNFVCRTILCRMSITGRRKQEESQWKMVQAFRLKLAGFVDAPMANKPSRYLTRLATYLRQYPASPLWRLEKSEAYHLERECHIEGP